MGDEEAAEETAEVCGDVGAAKYTVVMVRHGESVYNEQNKFCGWVDADLAKSGLEEAKRAGTKIKEKGLKFDIAFTSVLKRAIKTLFYIQDVIDLHWIPVVREWRLNERHYGALQGLNKTETAEKYGEDQVKIWRRAYDVPPPPVTEDDPNYPGKDPRYRKLPKEMIPKAECLQDTVNRVVPYWKDTIVPLIKAGKRVLITAHGNTLRAMSKYLDNIPDSEIVELNIPTAMPLVYELDEDMKPVNHYYLATDAEVEAAVNKVANQGKKRASVVQSVMAGSA